MKVMVEHLDVQRGGVRVLADVTLTIPSGTVTGLLGPNGSGKSTLLRAVAGIDAVSAGAVRYDGTPITGFSRRQLARRVAIMAQEHSEEFEIPVIDLVLLGRTPHGKGFGRDSSADVDLALDALARVRANHLATRLFSSLSGGERQRVLFARALVQDTPVLILDEPTNHLDVAHQLELLDLVRTANRTALVAMHDLNLAARHCDALGILANGRLIAHGSPQEALDTALIRSVFAVDSTAVTHPHTGQPHFLLDARTQAPAGASPPRIASPDGRKHP